MSVVATWREFEDDAPELAAAVRERFERRTHKTLATVRRDGSPRIGIECEIEHGELRFRAMSHSVKALDLLRDPRFALHSGTDDPPDWDGDAKVAGTARAEVRESPEHGRYHLFTADIREATTIGLNDARDRLVVESWHEGGGRLRLER